MNKLGLYFGQEKQEALLRGDISSIVLDRYFIYGFQTIGMHLCKARDGSPVMVQLQAKYAQMAWETLIELLETDDERAKVQGLLLLAHVFVIVGLPSSAQLYIPKMCKIIEKGNLRFLPAYGRPPELSEQVREEVTVLSQTIYLDNYFYLTLGGAAPVATARIEEEFRMVLQVRIIR